MRTYSLYKLNVWWSIIPFKRKTQPEKFYRFLNIFQALCALMMTITFDAKSFRFRPRTQTVTFHNLRQFSFSPNWNSLRNSSLAWLRWRRKVYFLIKMIVRLEAILVMHHHWPLKSGGIAFGLRIITSIKSSGVSLVGKWKNFWRAF